MIAKIWVALIPMLLLVLSCTKPTELIERYEHLNPSEALFAIQYDVIDNPDERRLELSFTNTLDQAVCFYPHFWPYATGGVVNDSPWAPVLVIGQNRYPIERLSGEYCPGCALLVAPGETVRSSMPYDAFHFPAALVNEKKTLEFVPKAYRCVQRLYKR